PVLREVAQHSRHGRRWWLKNLYQHPSGYTSLRQHKDEGPVRQDSRYGSVLFPYGLNRKPWPWLEEDLRHSGSLYERVGNHESRRPRHVPQLEIHWLARPSASPFDSRRSNHGRRSP